MEYDRLLWPSRETPYALSEKLIVEVKRPLEFFKNETPNSDTQKLVHGFGDVQIPWSRQEFHRSLSFMKNSLQRYMQLTSVSDAHATAKWLNLLKVTHNDTNTSGPRKFVDPVHYH